MSKIRLFYTTVVATGLLATSVAAAETTGRQSTLEEIMHYEALELCAAGEGGRLVAEGVTALGGRIPVNVSGGLIGRGHPLAATDVAQINEIVAQLRGEAGDRQVDGARIGLAQCMGADHQGDARACTVAILSS